MSLENDADGTKPNDAGPARWSPPQSCSKTDAALLPLNSPTCDSSAAFVSPSEQHNFVSLKGPDSDIDKTSVQSSYVRRDTRRTSASPSATTAAASSLCTSASAATSASSLSTSTSNGTDGHSRGTSRTVSAAPPAYIATDAVEGEVESTCASVSTKREDRTSSHSPSLSAAAARLPDSLPPGLRMVVPPPPPRTYYQHLHTFERRCQLSRKMCTLYGAAVIPVIVEPAESHLRQSPVPLSASNEAVGGGGEGRSSRISSLIGSSCTSRRSAAMSAIASWSGQQSLATPPATSTSASHSSCFVTPSTKSTLKCILPRTKSVAEVILTLRDRLALDSCQSLFLSVGENDVLVPGNSLLGDLYERYRNPDGFLYLSYLLENTFGGRRKTDVGAEKNVAASNDDVNDG